MNFPILSSLILLPSIGALFLFFTKSDKKNNFTGKYVALFTSAVNFFLSIYLWILFDQTTSEFQLQISSFINNIRDRVQDEYGLHRGTTPESEINKVLNSNKHKIRNDIDNLIESLNLNVMENV